MLDANRCRSLDSNDMKERDAMTELLRKTDDGDLWTYRELASHFARVVAQGMEDGKPADWVERHAKLASEFAQLADAREQQEQRNLDFVRELELHRTHNELVSLAFNTLRRH